MALEERRRGREDEPGSRRGEPVGRRDERALAIVTARLLGVVVDAVVDGECLAAPPDGRGEARVVEPEHPRLRQAAGETANREGGQRRGPPRGGAGPLA